MFTCPICKKENNDNLPVQVGENIIKGGCSDCNKTQVNEAWKEVLKKIDEILPDNKEEPC